jgi:hypothetical protein
MRAEIRSNANRVEAALADIQQEQKRNTDELVSVQKIQSTPNDAKGHELNLSVSYNMVGFDDTAWRTAQATGALGFMSYAEAERYSDIYGAEQTVLKEQDQVAEDETQMLGVAREVHPVSGTLTQENAGLVAKQLGIIEGHLLGLKLAARLLKAEQEAFLEGKEAPHSLSTTD